jgi:PKD repeat protein
VRVLASVLSDYFLGYFVMALGTGINRRATGRLALSSLPYLLVTALGVLAGAATAEAATRVELRALAQSINLQWDPVTSDSRIVGYEVHYGLASGAYTASVDAVDNGAATSTVTVPNLSEGTSYYFAVRSRNGDRSLLSGFTNEVCATVGEPADATADFMADTISGQAPLAVAFTAQVPGCTTGWAWNFGDGETSTEPQPTHVYQATGTFPVSLTISGPGIADTVTKTAYITVSAGPAVVSAPAEGLVAAYGFDEAGDILALDISGNGNDGVLSGPTRTSAGKFGGALSFDGINDWVTVTDHATLDLTSGMTLEAWVKPSALSGWRTALIKEAPSGLSYALYAHDDSPRPAAYISIGRDHSTPGSGALPTNTWSHLAATYDGARLRLFVNGVETSTTVSGSIEQSGQPLRIGGNAVWGEYFKGLIDEVRVYNRPLSAVEIRADMDAPVRTTSDSIGTFRPSSRRFFLDLNNNDVWDGIGTDAMTASFGIADDIPVVGDWNGDGIDDIGIFRPSIHRFYLDLNNNGAWDGISIDATTSFGAVGDIPVIGDWNGDNIDEIGIWRPATRRFFLDTNGNYAWDAGTDLVAPFGISTDLPVTGDWNGDGFDDIGVWRPATRSFFLDTNGNDTWDPGTDLVAPFGMGTDLPVIGDWDGDGLDDIGVWRTATGNFFLDTNGNDAWDVDTDLIGNFGVSTDLPLAGRW